MALTPAEMAAEQTGVWKWICAALEPVPPDWAARGFLVGNSAAGWKTSLGDASL